MQNYTIRGHSGEFAGKNKVRPLFILPGVFLFSRRNSRFRFWGLISWHLWSGTARHPGPAPPYHQVGLEVFNQGCWLTHGDLALEARVDLVAVVEHRLIPARVTSEWARLKGKGLASI